jgi:hypothetical protein
MEKKKYVSPKLETCQVFEDAMQYCTATDRTLYCTSKWTYKGSCAKPPMDIWLTCIPQYS